MGKCKNSKDPETIEELSDCISEVEEDVSTVAKKEPQLEKDISQMRDELLRPSEDGKVEKSVAYIKKASERVIRKLYAAEDKKRINVANEFLTDLVIWKWAHLLGGLDAIESSEELNNN